MELLGVIGNPISHSLSSVMHNQAFKKLGKEAIYVPMLVTTGKLKEAIAGAQALGFVGLNVTVPFKEQVIPYLTELTDQARATKSVNTIKFDGDQIIGHSTDGLGFEHALISELQMDLDKKNILLIGAGGAARAIVHQVLTHDCLLYIANRTVSRAEQIVNELSKAQSANVEVCSLDPSSLREIMDQIDIVVNTTSVGMEKTISETPIPLCLLEAKHTVIDIIYNPQESMLLKKARSKGCRVQNGIGMLVWQAAKAWEFWWGIHPPIDKMYETVKASLS